MMMSDEMEAHTFVEYERVNLSIAPSSRPDGLDLPLNDMATLRFFFNLGLRSAHFVVLSQQQLHNPPPAAAYALPELLTPPTPTLLPLRQWQEGKQICSLSTGFISKEEDITAAFTGPAQPSTHHFPALIDTPSASSSSSTVSSLCPLARVPSQKTNHHQREFPSATLPSSTSLNPIFGLSEFRFTRAFQPQEPVDGRERRESSSSIAALLSQSQKTTSGDRRAECLQGCITSEEHYCGISGDAHRETMVQDPVQMVEFLNACLGSARRTLQHMGTPVSTVDARGMQVDFSSRPIDSIFQLARAQTELERFDTFSHKQLLKHRTITTPVRKIAEDPMRMNRNH